jgi:hypothetical protein
MNKDIEYKGGITIRSNTGGAATEVKDLSQLSDTLRRTYDEHINWARQFYRERYSEELWAKADELIAHTKIEFFGEDDASNTQGFGKDGYINGAYQRWEEQCVAHADKNKAEITTLIQQRQQARDKMNQHRPAVDRIAKTNGTNSRSQRESWQDVAEKLGILKYLTDTGQLSKAKLKKKSKGDSTVIKQVLDTYNTQYVTQANAALRQAQQMKKSHNQADLKERVEYERQWREIQRLDRQIALLSAHMIQQYTDNWSYTYNKIKEKQAA